jgi:peptidoglycan/xylan/chitin deacetylase (PgdA/CDA1 family)
VRALLAGLALLAALPATAQSIALTFDDGLDPQAQPAATAWNGALLKALKDADVRSMILPTCAAAQSAAGLQLVRAWGEAGHRIANHTWSHQNFSSAAVTADAFIADVARCDQVLKTLPGWSPRLRFPYLKEGATAEKRDAMRRWMTANGYKPAPVSIDASDWYYSSRWTAHRRTHGERDDALYYDGLSRQVLGRSAKHVLLLHTNAINASFLPDVIAMFRAKGWQIISADEAFADPMYAMQPTHLPAGESILWALAKQAGVDGLRYPAEDGRYEEALLNTLESRAVQSVP